MQVTPQVIEAAKQMGNDNLNRQYTARPGDTIRADRVVDLLVNATSPAAQRGARDLLRQMGLAPWMVIANIHQSEDDNTPHITIEVGRQRYHLRLDIRGCTFDITVVDDGETVRPSGHRPWVRPGAIG